MLLLCLYVSIIRSLAQSVNHYDSNTHNDDRDKHYHQVDESLLYYHAISLEL